VSHSILGELIRKSDSESPLTFRGEVTKLSAGPISGGRGSKCLNLNVGGPREEAHLGEGEDWRDENQQTHQQKNVLRRRTKGSVERRGQREEKASIGHC